MSPMSYAIIVNGTHPGMIRKEKNYENSNDGSQRRNDMRNFVKVILLVILMVGCVPADRMVLDGHDPYNTASPCYEYIESVDATVVHGIQGENGCDGVFWFLVTGNPLALAVCDGGSSDELVVYSERDDFQAFNYDSSDIYVEEGDKVVYTISEFKCVNTLEPVYYREIIKVTHEVK